MMENNQLIYDLGSLLSEMGNKKETKYKVGDIVEDKWGRKGKIIALRGCNSCGQLYEIENKEGYIVEGNIKCKVGENNE